VLQADVRDCCDVLFVRGGIQSKGVLASLSAISHSGIGAAVSGLALNTQSSRVDRIRRDLDAVTADTIEISVHEVPLDQSLLSSLIGALRVAVNLQTLSLQTITLGYCSSDATDTLLKAILASPALTALDCSGCAAFGTGFFRTLCASLDTTPFGGRLKHLRLWKDGLDWSGRRCFVLSPAVCPWC